MASVVTTKSLFHVDSSSTTTSTSYVFPTSFRSLWLYTSANWDGTVEVYFEAVLSNSAGATASAILSNAAGSANVTGSEVQTTATSQTRIRSGDILSALTNATDYGVRIKASSGTTSIYNAKLIIKQTGTITKKEYYIPLTAGASGTTSTSLIEATRSCYVEFDPTQWDGTYSVYLEATGQVNSGGFFGFAQLRNVTDSTTDAAAISTSTTTPTRMRSTALSMAGSVKTYSVHYRTNSGAVTFSLSDACLVIIQSGSPTKGVFHDATKAGYLSTTATSNTLLNGSYLYWDDNDWSVTSQTIMYAGTLRISNAASTATSPLLDSGSNEDVNIPRTGSNLKVYVSTSFNPDDDMEYRSMLKTSNASHTAEVFTPRIVSVVDFSDPAVPYTPRIVEFF